MAKFTNNDNRYFWEIYFALFVNIIKDSNFFLFSACYFFTQYSDYNCDMDVCGKWQARATEDMRHILVLPTDTNVG